MLRRDSGISESNSMRMTDPRRRRLSARSKQPHQVFGLFLDLDVAVADDAERPGSLCTL